MIEMDGDLEIDLRPIEDGRRRGAGRAVLAYAGALLFLAASAAFSTSAQAAESPVSPLPASDYTARPVCAAPAPGYAGCLALRLVPRTAAARAYTHPLGIARAQPITAAKASEGAFGLRPQDLHSVYRLPATASAPQTIAIVDAYNDLTAESDLKVYDKEFGLPELPQCTIGEASGCFEKINQSGQAKNPPFPQTEEARQTTENECHNEGNTAACEAVDEADGWAVETSLDIEVSHAICSNCRIVLVEADSPSFLNLETAERTAVGGGATEISNSWGGPERGEKSAEDNASAFNQPGIVITAAAGDNGYLDWSANQQSERGYADYPASSPHVVAVGGSRLSVTAKGEWASETVWNGDGAGGGGCSSLAAPEWQSAESDWLSVGCGSGRAVVDISADADPYTGVAIYDSTPASSTEGAPEWVPLGGTSFSSPLIAATFALAGGAAGVAYPAKTLYENEIVNPSALHDVLSGSNGECKRNPTFEADGSSSCTPTEEATNSHCVGALICKAAPGYDGPTGIGTPDGIVAFTPSSEEAKRKNAEEKLREKEQREKVQREKGQHEKELREEEQREEKLREEERNVGSGGSGAGGGGNSGAGAGSGGEARKAFEGLPLPPGAHPSGAPLSVPGSSTALPILSALALTRSASAALRHGPAKVSRVAFTFTLNVPARVRVTLAEQVLAHGHKRWRTLPDSLTIFAAKGRGNAHLSARGTLTPGRYRLTLTPLRGPGRALTFQIG